jgi:DNA-binding NtrC family response regulator
LTERISLEEQALVRAGRTLFVFHNDAPHMLAPPPIERFGMAGRFHVGALMSELEEAAESRRHLLILGPSGSGKELAAKAIAALSSEGDEPLLLLAHNAARFSSEEEATSTLFGVGAKVFSNVNPRAGLIERAEGGLLFLDEIHNLTVRVQRSLLRVIEDREYARIGETGVKRAGVRFVFASNAGDPESSMAHDLYARLRLLRVPSLRERVADIPAIFAHVLREKLKAHELDEALVSTCVMCEHIELLCLDGFPSDNVRGLIDIADRIATKVSRNTAPADAVSRVFQERFHQETPLHAATVPGGAPRADSKEARDEREGAASQYEQNKALIIATYRDREENISATMRVLRAHGISCSRRWLAAYLKKWGIKQSR